MALPPSSTAPLEPVSLDYAKMFLRIDHDHEDDLIADFITLARIRVETLTRYTLITRALQHSVTAEGASAIKVCIAPMGGVTGVSLVDHDGVLRALGPEDYQLTLRGDHAFITPNSSKGWGEFFGKVSRVMIDYYAGYGNAPEDVPHPFRQAILLLLAQSYEHRGDSADAPLPMMVDAVLMPYRKFWL